MLEKFRPCIHADFPEEGVDVVNLVFVGSADVWITSLDVDADNSREHLMVSITLGAEDLVIELVSFL